MIKKAQRKANVKTPKRVSQARIKNELEIAQDNRTTAKKQDSTDSLCWKLRAFGLDKMNRYAAHQHSESDIAQMHSGLNSALYIDTHCNGDEQCDEIRTRVNSELWTMIEAERVKAGIAKEKPEMLIRLADKG